MEAREGPCGRVWPLAEEGQVEEEITWGESKGRWEGGVVAGEIILIRGESWWRDQWWGGPSGS